MLQGLWGNLRERDSIFAGFMGKSEGKRQLARSRYRWEEGVKMNLQELGWSMDYIDLATERLLVLVKAVMNHRVP